MNREQRRPHLGCNSLPSIAQWRTNRDHMADQVRTLTGESAGNQSTQAVTDDNNPATRFLRDIFQTTQHALDLALRASEVDVDSREMRAITNLLKPLRHRVERPVAGAEARDQQNRFALAYGNILAVKDRILEKR